MEQNHSEATYCAKISKEDGKIDWNRGAREIFHKYQAYSPWPGIFDIYQGKRLLFEKISFSDAIATDKKI